MRQCLWRLARIMMRVYIFCKHAPGVGGNTVVPAASLRRSSGVHQASARAVFHLIISSINLIPQQLRPISLIISLSNIPFVSVSEHQAFAVTVVFVVLLYCIAPQTYKSVSADCHRRYVYVCGSFSRVVFSSLALFIVIFPQRPPDV